jgi:hypothetical protein
VPRPGRWRFSEADSLLEKQSLQRAASEILGTELEVSTKRTVRQGIKARGFFK